MTGQCGRILMLGDAHGDLGWMLEMIRLAHRYDAERILQVGDFGYDNDGAGQRYLAALTRELDNLDLDLWFVDGNHENHAALLGNPIEAGTGMRPITTRVTHLPRGHSWVWGDTVWVAAGGASSINAHQLTPGYDWWPGDVMNMAEQQAVLDVGHADVMVTHDAPWGTPALAREYKQHLPVGQRLSEWPDEAVAASDAHQHLIRDLADELGVTRLFHGHHHHRYDDVITRPGGGSDLHVHGLGMNGQGEGAFMLVDTTGHPVHAL